MSTQVANRVLNILVLYDPFSTHVNTTYEYLKSFQAYSAHRIFYAPATHEVKCLFDLSFFDIIMIHYSVRLSLTWQISSSWIKGLLSYEGYKVLFIQDEYDTTETARSWIEKLNFNTVFTCVPHQYIKVVYPPDRFPNTEFINVLTGYVPMEWEQFKKYTKPLKERKNMVGYRGRELPYWYGSLGREKFTIAQEAKSFFSKKNISIDIEWNDGHRIYGEAWYHFIADCRATLGTESGSNIFDYDGSIRKNIENELKNNSKITFEEIFDKYLVEHEGKVMMNQISPRAFEAIALRTALVLFEGNYSGILTPNLHYIQLKKDFSNIDEVLKKLNDDVYLEKITDRAYKDIIESEKYSYKKMVTDLDGFLLERLSRMPSKVGNDILFSFLTLNAKSGRFFSSKSIPLTSLLSNLPLTPDATKIFNRVVVKRSRLLMYIKLSIYRIWRCFSQEQRSWITRLIPRYVKIKLKV